MQHPWQTWLGFTGIMLGVMMVVAVDLANSSAGRALDLSVATINGNLTHQILAGSPGVPDAVFTRLRTELGIQRSAPTISGQVRIGSESFTLLGLDLFSELSLQRQRPGMPASTAQVLGLSTLALGQPDSILVNAATARRLQVQTGETLLLSEGGRAHQLTVLGLLPPTADAATDNVLFTDIATAQQVLNKPGVIDSIDLILDPDEVNLLQDWHPEPNLRLVAVDSRNASLTQLTNAFHINLLAMSLLALLVAALLIYNTMSLSVLERRASMGVLRSIGVSQGGLIRLVLMESAVLGVLASLAGVMLGLLLGQGLVKLVTRTVDDLYFNLTVTRFIPDYLVMLKGWSWGVGITVAAALLPAWQAGQSPPITLQHRQEDQTVWQQRLPWLGVGGVLLLLLGYAVVLPASDSLVSGFVALNLIIFGFCLLVPVFMTVTLKAILHLPSAVLTLAGRMSLRNLQYGINRSGLAVAALTVAVSVTVGVGVMVGSFRQTVILWLDQTLSGDVQISRLDDGPGLPEALIQRIVSTAGVSGWLLGYSTPTDTPFGPVRIMAFDGSQDPPLYMKAAQPDATQAFNAGAAVYVAEPFAWLHNLALGDTLAFAGPEGEQSTRIAGIFYDYTTGPGLMVMAPAAYTRLWPGQPPSRLTLSLGDPADTAAMVRTLRSLTDGESGTIGVAGNADIRTITLAIFDRTFAITRVLRMLAILVAFVGVLSALIALQLQRMREYAVLRATGMTVGDIISMIAIQTLVMGLYAGVLAIPLGLLMSQVLIDVINVRSFGWSMQHVLPAGVLVQALILAVGAAALAALAPMRAVARVQPALALRGE